MICLIINCLNLPQLSNLTFMCLNFLIFAILLSLNIMRVETGLLDFAGFGFESCTANSPQILSSKFPILHISSRHHFLNSCAN